LDYLTTPSVDILHYKKKEKVKVSLRRPRKPVAEWG